MEDLTDKPKSSQWHSTTTNYNTKQDKKIVKLAEKELEYDPTSSNIQQEMKKKGGKC